MAPAAQIKKELPDDEDQSLGAATLGRSVRQVRRSWTAALVSTSIRLAVWYALVVAIFFCPGSLDQLRADSSQVCRPYLHLKSYATPHLAPYYQTYAAPYVDAARPVTEKLYTTVYQPTFAYAKLGYEQYGAPRIVQLQKHGQKEWARVVKPSLDNVQALAQDHYNASLGPYVDHAYRVVSPYYTTARDSAVYQYQNTILPSYNKALPYAASAYDRSYIVATELVLPYMRKSGEVIYAIITRRIWPPIRILYGENVQPQLLKIRERLINYHDARAIESAMETESDQSSSQSSSSAASSSSSATYSSSSVKSASATKLPDMDPVQSAVKMSLSAELKSWKAKFAKASRKGTEDLKSHVTELTASQIGSQADGTGDALIVQLEETTSRSLQNLKSDIISIVASLPEEESDEDEQHAVEASHDKIRSAGKKIKEIAQKLRAWKISYQDKTEDLVRDATDNTLDVIDHIRELGLQEIGMRYAHEEDATHKEWREYHALKNTFDTWREDIENAGMKHSGLVAAKQAGEDVEARGMAIAEDAAKELARLKRVALWKIRAKDTTDDFSTRAIPAAALRAKEIVAEKIVDLSEAIVGTSQGTMESISSAAINSAFSLAEAAPTDVAYLADAISSGVSATASIASSSASSLYSAASEYVPSQITKAGEEVQSSMSTATVQASHVGSSVSSIVASEAASGVSSAINIQSDAASSAKRVGGVISSVTDEIPGSLASAPSILESKGSGAASSAQSSIESVNKKASHTIQSGSSSLLSEASGSIVSAASTASKGVSSLANIVESEASSMSSEGGQSLTSAMSQASAALLSSSSTLDKAASNVVADSAKSASLSIASIVSKAGDTYADLTSSLMSAASSESSGVS